MFEAVENNNLRISTRREANWYFHYLKWKGLINRVIEAPAISEKANQVLAALSHEFVSNTPTNDFIAEMQSIYERQLDRDAELEWITYKDQRLINWLWERIPGIIEQNAKLYFVSHNTYSELPRHIPILDEKLYTYKFNFAQTTDEKHEAIIFALDVNPSTIMQRENSLLLLKKDWDQLRRAIPKLKWLTKSAEVPNEALTHLQNHAENFDKNILVCPLRFDLLDCADPIRTAMSIQTIIDCYYSDCRRAALIKLKKDLTTKSSEEHKELEIKYLDEYRLQAIALVKLMRKAFDARQLRLRRRMKAK